MKADRRWWNDGRFKRECEACVGDAPALALPPAMSGEDAYRVRVTCDPSAYQIHLRMPEAHAEFEAAMERWCAERAMPSLLRFEAGDAEALTRALRAAGVHCVEESPSRYGFLAHSGVEVRPSAYVPRGEVWAVYSDGSVQVVARGLRC